MVAFAISIALHEAAAGFISWPGSPSQSEREVVRRVTIARIATPSPKPSPKPSPTPTPPATPPPRTFTHAPRIVAPEAPRLAVRRNAAPPRPIPTSAQAVVAAVPAAGQGVAAGTAAGPGSPGNGGTGAGNGTDEPCGAVTFSDPHGSRYDPGTRGFFVDIRMSVRFPDGHAESTILDYPFYYADENANPWSERNRSNPDVPMLMQRPPEALAASEPPLVQYVLAHTEAGGFTLLRDCPAPSP